MHYEEDELYDDILNRALLFQKLAHRLGVDPEDLMRLTFEAMYDIFGYLQMNSDFEKSAVVGPGVAAAGGSFLGSLFSSFWSGLTSLGGWVKERVISPMFYLVVFGIPIGAAIALSYVKNRTSELDRAFAKEYAELVSTKDTYQELLEELEKAEKKRKADESSNR